MANKEGMDSSISNSVVGLVLDDKYKLVKLLGRGGMGDVYEAQHLRLQRPVAVKLLRSQLIDGSQGNEPLRRFEREAKTACRIDHPNAVAIFDYGVVDSQPYLVMNLVQGITLKQFLLQGNSLSTGEIVDILEQIASALHQAHSLGIVHRDLKPDNIMLDEQSDGKRRAQVLDFGLAKLVSDSLSGSSLTNSGDTLGTPLYMSPEQVQGIETTAASDIYSLGIIAYEMLAGDVPFRAEQAMSVLYKHLHETPPALRVINPEFPDLPLVENVLQKVLAKEPEARFEGVLDFVASLKCALDGTEYVPPIVQASSRRRSIAAPFVLVGLLAVVVLAFVLGRETQPESVALQSSVRRTSTNKIEERQIDNMPLGEKIKTVISSQPVQKRIEEAERLIKQHKVRVAHTILLQIVIQVPDHAHAHYLLGKTHMMLRKPARAHEHLKRATTLEPENLEYAKAYNMVNNAKPGADLEQQGAGTQREIIQQRARNLRKMFRREPSMNRRKQPASQQQFGSQSH